MKVHFIMKITTTLVMAYLSLTSGNQVEIEQKNEQLTLSREATIRKRIMDIPLFEENQKKLKECLLGASTGSAIVVSGGEIVSEGAVIPAGTAASAGWLGTAMGVATAVGPAGWAMIGVKSILDCKGAVLLEMGETGALLDAYNDQIKS